MAGGTSTVSGLVSGIDWESTIQQLMQIERRRSTLLEARKDENATKLNLWAQVQSKVSTLQSAMEGMDQKSEFAVKSASSSDTSIVTVAASASAAVGAHTVEVLQLAKAHRIAAQGWADKNSTGVGDSGGNLVINVNGETITIADADLSSDTTLEELRNLINSSPDNTGLVTASILDDGSGSNAYRLVLTAGETGSENRIAITSNPTSLNFSGTAVDNAETQSGWTGTAGITTGGTYSGTVNKSFTFTIAGSGAQTLGTGDVTINWADSLGGSGSFVVPDGYSGGAIAVSQGVQLTFGSGTLTGGQTFNVDVFNPELSAAQDARIKVDGIYMNKASNSVTDVLEGLTLNLQSAKAGTTVDVSVSNDKAAVRSKIDAFINAYNSLTADLATFSSYDAENEVAAPLLGDGFLSGIRSSISTATANSVKGLAPNAQFDCLALLGIKTTNNGTLVADSAKLSDALDNHFDDVINLFTESFSAEDSKLNFVSGGARTVSGEYGIVVNYDASGAVTSATINGKAATIEGKLIRGAKGTPLEDLVLSFTSPGAGAGSVSTTFRFSQGMAGIMASEASRIADTDSGPIHFATDSLNTTNEAITKQIEAWEERLKTTEDELRRQYSRLESVISQMKSQSNYIASVLG